MMRVPNRERQIVKAQFLRLSDETGINGNTCGGNKYFQVGKATEVPVFKMICEKGNKPSAEAACRAAAGPSFIWPSEIDSLPATGNSILFPAVTFDSYNVSCACGKKSEYCPGLDLAQNTNPTIPHITPSVEGLLLSNYDSPLDLREENRVNLGNYQISLIK